MKNRIDAFQIEAIPLSFDVCHGLEAYIKRQPDPPSRQDALREIVEDWLIEHGYMGRDF